MQAEIPQDEESSESNASSFFSLKEQIKNLREHKKDLSTNASDLKKEIADLKKNKNEADNKKILALKGKESEMKKEILDIETMLEKLTLDKKAEEEKEAQRKLEAKIAKDKEKLLKDQKKLEAIKNKEKK